MTYLGPFMTFMETTKLSSSMVIQETKTHGLISQVPCNGGRIGKYRTMFLWVARQANSLGGEGEAVRRGNKVTGFQLVEFLALLKIDKEVGKDAGEKTGGEDARSACTLIHQVWWQSWKGNSWRPWRHRKVEVLIESSRLDLCTT